MVANARSGSNTSRGIELSGMTLPVFHGQRITLETLRARDRQRRRRIQAT
jgi:phage protein U